jgi:hypothetical protein
MYSYSVSFAGKMASGRGKSKDVIVTDEQLAQVGISFFSDWDGCDSLWMDWS